MSNIILFQIVAFAVAITFHEFMHAWSANLMGDPSAKALGRVSLNPIAHVDILGTIILPLFLIVSGSGFVFGWAKPVPINPNNFRDRKIGEILTSLAGPMANFAIAFIFSILYNLMPNSGDFSTFLAIMVSINVLLMVFNLIPIPPLDGSHVLKLFLPYKIAAKFEMYGPFILFPFIFLFGGYIIGPLVAIVQYALGVPWVF